MTQNVSTMTENEFATAGEFPDIETLRLSTQARHKNPTSECKGYTAHVVGSCTPNSDAVCIRIFFPHFLD